VIRSFVLAGLLIASPVLAQGPGISAERHTAAVPTELAAPVASLLAPGGIHATTPKATLDLWFVKALPVKADAPSWAAVEEGTLVGAVRLPAEFRDIRGRIIKAGVYTLRYGIQPDNGDHLGVSPYRAFLLLSPAALDSNPAPRGHDGTIEISKQAIGGSHPAVLSIDPLSATAAMLTTHATELEHQALIVEVPTAHGGTTGTLRFGIVLIGRIEA
jgi:hypothetical protein